MQKNTTNVVVIGAGFMGTGIAQVCIQKQLSCLLIDTDQACLDRAVTTIQTSLKKLHEKGVIPTAPETALSCLETKNTLDLPENPEWVIEAVFEDEALKKDLLTRVEQQVGEDTKIATNTSSIPVSRLASFLSTPARFVGLHFFGPVPLMDLVEVVKGNDTSEAVFSDALAFVKSIGKYGVGVKKDLPGFVMNRVFAAAFRECQDLVSQGVALPEDIDAGMRLGYGWRAGPFQIADNAGLDTVLRINKSMKALGETHLYTHADLLEKLVEKGDLGRKSGKGFYRYDQ